MIDEKRIKNNLKDFSFPRLSGTKQETESYNIAKKKIESLKLQPSVQEFSFSTFYSRIYPKISISLTFWLLITIFLNLNWIFTIISVIITLLIILPLIVITRNPEKIRFGKRFLSRNLFVKLESKSNQNKKEEIIMDEDRNVFFLSHLDSKGQKFSIKTRVLFIKFWIFSFIVLTLILIIRTIVPTQMVIWLNFIGLFLLGINFTTTILTLINTTNNKSMGAIDDASGIVSVLELLNYYTDFENRLTNFNFWFVFTGAEESGTMGIRNFYKILKTFDRNKLVVFNFDSIAKNISPFCRRSNPEKYKNFYDAFIKEANKFNLKLNTYRFNVGIHSDGIFTMGKKKLLGVGFGDLTSYKYVHSVEDTIEKVNPNVLKELCLLITNFLKEIDSQICSRI